MQNFLSLLDQPSHSEMRKLKLEEIKCLLSSYLEPPGWVLLVPPLAL